MTTKSEDLVRNNPNVTLAEYVWTRAKELLVKWEWLKESDPIPTSVSMDPQQEQHLAETRRAMEDALALSDEDAKNGCEKHIEKQHAIVAGYKRLLSEVQTWQPSSSNPEDPASELKERLVNDLSRGIREEEPVLMTPEQYKRKKIRRAVEHLDVDEKGYAQNVKVLKNINSMLTALRATFGDPPAPATKPE